MFSVVVRPQDQEQHESDLRGSRGVLLVGVLMLIMAFSNFRNTVRSVSELSCDLAVSWLAATENKPMLLVQFLITCSLLCRWPRCTQSRS